MPKRKRYIQVSKRIKRVIKFLDILNEKIEKTKNEYEPSELAKRVIGMIELQHRLPQIQYFPDKDRTIPLESIEKDSFRLKNAAEIKNPQIHYGGYANELTRSMNLLALAIGSDIFFRNGAYKPETEEGRALLSHELTHVQQYIEKRTIVKTKEDRENLEQEAERNEEKELYKTDPIITKVVEGIPFRIKKSKEHIIEKMLMEELENKVEEFCLTKSKEEVEKFTKAYLKIKDDGKLEQWIKGKVLE